MPPAERRPPLRAARAPPTHKAKAGMDLRWGPLLRCLHRACNDSGRLPWSCSVVGCCVSVSSVLHFSFLVSFCLFAYLFVCLFVAGGRGWGGSISVEIYRA